MATDKLRADYDALAQIARSFGRHAANTRQSLSRLKQHKEALQGGLWLGDGPSRFYQEFDSSLVPGLTRLIDALESAQQSTAQISQIMKRAEAEAAAVLRGQGDAAGSGAAGGNTLPAPATGEAFALPKWLTDLLEGLFLGDFSENSSLLKLLAQTGVGFIPYAGQVADARDIIANVKDIIQGKEWAWAGLALAVVSVIPGLDALKGVKALKPLFNALGGKGSREALEFIVKNPGEIVRIGKTLSAVMKHPEVIETLVKNPDIALRLIRTGWPELVEGFPNYGDEVFNLLEGASIPRVFEGFDLRPPQRNLDRPYPGPKLHPRVEVFVTLDVHGDFQQYDFLDLKKATAAEVDETLWAREVMSKKLLWTIDGQGAHFAPEQMIWLTSRGGPSHTNISDTAYFGGEAWRIDPNTIAINAGSGAFGYNGSKARRLQREAPAEYDKYREETQERFNRAAEYFRQIGFEVIPIPVGEIDPLDTLEEMGLL